MSDVLKAQEAWMIHRFQLPIYYEDTDFSGYVYHANYLKFFERGREEVLGRRYLQELYGRGFHYVVAALEIAYRRPARHADLLEIETRMQVSTSSLTLVEHVARLVEPADPLRVKEPLPQELVRAKVKMVSVDSEGKPMRPPADVYAHFAAMASAQS